MARNVIRRLGSLFAAGLIGLSLAASSQAASLRQGSVGGASAVTGSLPGQVLWTYYQTVFRISVFFSDGTEERNRAPGDNILRLVNPNGAANPLIAGAQSQTVCAMIYVFDDDQEMGECCGCPLTSAQLATFSVGGNLTADWSLPAGPEGPDNDIGSIGIGAAAKNVPTSRQPGVSNGQGCLSNQSAACNGGCDPTNSPGYVVTTSSNLLGSMTRLPESCSTSGAIVPIGFSDFSQNFFKTLGVPSSLTFGRNLVETALGDDASGDPTNLSYLQAQCGALIGNGTGGGICTCPTE